VKDPLYLVNEFSKWHKEKRKNSLLLIIGTTYVEYKEFSEKVLGNVNNCEGIFYHEAVEMPLLFSLILKSVAVLNSSLSEGLSNSLLESFQLGIPVIARDIVGNRNLIENDKNGLLYSTPTEFISKAERLLNEKELRNRISKDAFSKVNGLNELESNSYVNLFKNMISESSSNNDGNN